MAVEAGIDGPDTVNRREQSSARPAPGVAGQPGVDAGSTTSCWSPRVKHGAGASLEGIAGCHRVGVDDLYVRSSPQNSTARRSASAGALACLARHPSGRARAPCPYQAPATPSARRGRARPRSIWLPHRSRCGSSFEAGLVDDARGGDLVRQDSRRGSKPAGGGPR